MVFFRKYNVTLDTSTAGSLRVRVPIRKAASADFATGSDWTPATGDVKVSKDGGAQANIGTLPSYSNGSWEFTLTGTELSAKQIEVRVVDSATKAVDDEGFNVETFGNSSAMWPTNYAGGSAGALVTSGTGTDQLSVAAGVVKATDSNGDALATQAGLDGIPGDVWLSATRTLTAGTNIVLAKGAGVTGFNDLDAAGIRSAVGLATDNLDTQLSGVSTLDGADVRSAVGLATANLDTQLSGLSDDIGGIVGGATNNISVEITDTQAS